MNEQHHPTRSASGPADTPPGLVRLFGQLDQDTGRSAAIDAALQHAVTHPDSPRKITADVSGLAFCDSTGLNILLRAQLAATTHGRTLRLLRLLERTGALTLFTLHPTPPTAA
ncbi:STAS domain-containing protein [Streptomyces sp. DK15]|uniref:STAS domain-containing protein n=1 Tax=Streptomyces sp. DK15 TaxID=2957499 RepID=UPI0029BEF376|nr:STAS domain-containing protein [Streptomyces sp. DK15]MDX2394135.1 STAS domain-containing protein [Streptomyces sp. DK15]